MSPDKGWALAGIVFRWGPGLTMNVQTPSVHTSAANTIRDVMTEAQVLRRGGLGWRRPPPGTGRADVRSHRPVAIGRAMDVLRAPRRHCRPVPATEMARCRPGGHLRSLRA